MKQYADIMAFDKNGELVLIAEARSRRGKSSDWAAKMRRNMLAHGLMPNAPYFLLALPDAFYLWDGSGRSAQFSEPTRRVDPDRFLKPLYDKTGISPTNLTERSFEFIITSWLNQVLRTQSPRDLRNGEQDWLVESGLFDRLAGGHLELDTAA